MEEVWYLMIINNTLEVSGVFSSFTTRCVFFKTGKPPPSPNKQKCV